MGKEGTRVTLLGRTARDAATALRLATAPTATRLVATDLRHAHILACPPVGTRRAPLYHLPEMSAITHLFAGVPVSDLDAGIDWYTRFFGRPPDMRAGEEVLWEIDEHAWLFIEPPEAASG